MYTCWFTHSFGALIVTLKSLPPIRGIALIRTLTLKVCSHVEHVHMCVCAHVSVHACLHKRYDQIMMRFFFFFFYRLPEGDIKAIGALSVLVSFPDLD